MVWNYPEISKEDFINHLKGFVDLLILASGFQSTGVPAHWDAENCRKALQWGLYFENVLRSINSSDTFGDSVREIDEAISEMKSNPLFPKGLENLSSNSLSKAREFVLEHLMNNSTLKDKQLRAILLAAVESGDDITDIIDRKLCERQSIVSCVLALETGLKTLSKNIEPKESLQREDNDITLSSSGEWPIELSTWKTWQSKGLSYFLCKRTLRLVSGASLIFSAPKAQWAEVLKRLRDSADDEIFIEKIELLLLGCVTTRWTHLIEAIMSVSYQPLTVSEQYEELSKLLVQRSKNLKENKIALDSKVEEILEYLTEILENRFHHLWKLPSVLAAAAISSWSPLFGQYLSEIEKQLKGDLSTTRYKDLNEHKDCELAERVWWLYVFHKTN